MAAGGSRWQQMAADGSRCQEGAGIPASTYNAQGEEYGAGGLAIQGKIVSVSDIL